MKVVLDASAFMAWALPDESSPMANAAVALAFRGEAVVPTLWAAEITNILLIQQKKRRITEEFALNLIAELAEVPLIIDGRGIEPPRMHEIHRLARRHGLTAYDTIYLELALRRSLPIASLDQDLLRAAVAEGLPSFAHPSI